MRSADEFNEVRQLIAAGMNDCAISRHTGIPRPTVRDWRCRPQVLTRIPAGSMACGVDHDFAALPAAPYSYLLGLYLGDGCISRSRRVWRLRVVLDTKYPAIIDRCREAIDMLMPAQRARVMQLPKNCAEVSRTPNIGRACSPSTAPAKSTPDCTRTVAASAHRPGHRGIHSRPDPQRRLSRRRQRSQREKHPLPLHEYVRGHPRAVHRCTRRPWYSVDSVEQEGRLYLPKSRDRPSRHIRRAKGPRGTVGWCPLHGVGDRRSSRW